MNFTVAFVPMIVVTLITLHVDRLSFKDAYNVLYKDVTGPVTLGCTGSALPNSGPTIDCTAMCPLSVFDQIVVTRLVLVFFVWFPTVGTCGSVAPRAVRRSVQCLRLLSRDFPAVTSTDARVVGLRTVLGLPGNARRFLTSLRKRCRTFRRMLQGTSKTVGEGMGRVFNGALHRGRGGRLYALVCCPRRGLSLMGTIRASLSS